MADYGLPNLPTADDAAVASSSQRVRPLAANEVCEQGDASPARLRSAMSVTLPKLRQAPAELEICSDTAEVRRIQQLIIDELQACRIGERDIFGIRLALEEALVNAIKHGNQLDRTKKVRIAYHVDSETFFISIRDEGPGFNPEDIPDPTLEENLERSCGRGLMLMRHYMTEVRFVDKGNEVVMWKCLPANCKKVSSGK
jgi:serine/threonine-protein kinase RsbW